MLGISETKLDNPISSSEIEIKDYKLLRLARSRREGVVGCYVKTILIYNYKQNFCENTESIFIDIFLPKTKPILVGILYKPLTRTILLKTLKKHLQDVIF